MHLRPHLALALIGATGLLLVARCATPYQPVGVPGGYEETWLSEREVIVLFTANGYTSAKTAAGYAAFRACEVTLQNGFTHFVVLDQEESASEETSELRPERVEVVPNVYGGVTATRKPAETMTTFKPSTQLRIVLLKDEEVESSTATGRRPVSARFYIEKNAPPDIKARILQNVTHQ